MLAKRIMVQGTGSGVGKSIITAALCRIFKQDGYKVAPFKAQNMALNSFVTSQGGEMGRAQVVQAEAAGIEPTVDMNPILIKPTSDLGAQIILRGKPLGNMLANYYHNYKTKLIQIVSESFLNLARKYQIIVIEGAGSPAEINLRENDIVNMKMAEIADSSVLLVADIDKGGVFAWIVGTLELLTEKEKDRVKGLIINKFRGDINILKPGLDYLEEKCQKDILGIIPYFKDIRIEEEDSLPLEKAISSPFRKKNRVNIEVLYLPHISNFTDFDCLEEEEDVSLYYVGNGKRIGTPDLLIIPGSKNTIDDLSYLKKTGYYSQILALARKGKIILGICGGYQMLGKEIQDPYHTESTREKIEGLGLLDVTTILESSKITSQVKASLIGKEPFFIEEEISGYEIHTGITKLLKGVRPWFKITRRSSPSENLARRHGRDPRSFPLTSILSPKGRGNKWSGPPSKVNIEDGAINKEGKIMGTYIHGLFDNHHFRGALLNYLRKRKGLSLYHSRNQASRLEKRNKEYDKLANLVRKNLDIEKIYQILE